jgi:hypothetical protein
MQRFTRSRGLVLGGTVAGRIIRMAGSALTVQAALVASVFGQQAADGSAAARAGEPNAPAASGFGASPGVCFSYGVPGLNRYSGCLTRDGYNPARMIFNRSTPDGGWAVYGSVDPQGDPTICAGPSVGLQWGWIGASASPSACVTYRRDRSTAAPAGLAMPKYPNSDQDNGGALLDRARQADDQAYQQMRDQTPYDPNAYNNLYASDGGSPASAPAVPMLPAPNPSASAGMTAAQFQASVNPSMQQFRQADAPGYRTNSPRNQYDSQGYRIDSSRPQYDSQGYRIDSTQPATPLAQGNVTRFTYDPNAQNTTASGPVSQPSQAPVIPAVTRRDLGTQSQTAALKFPG